MHINDEIKIKNSVGVLRVKLLQRLNSLDVIKGNCKILPAFTNLRWECHAAADGSNVIMLSEKNTLKKCYIAVIADGKVEYWEGAFCSTEKPDDVYELLGEADDKPHPKAVE